MHAGIQLGIQARQGIGVGRIAGHIEVFLRIVTTIIQHLLRIVKMGMHVVLRYDRIRRFPACIHDIAKGAFRTVEQRPETSPLHRGRDCETGQSAECRKNVDVLHQGLGCSTRGPTGHLDNERYTQGIVQGVVFAPETDLFLHPSRAVLLGLRGSGQFETGLAQTFAYAVDNIAEFDITLDQRSTVLRKIRFEFEQIFDGLPACFCFAQQP